MIGEKSLPCFIAVVLIFFIAGLLYLLCFEHVDHLGAYSIPSETGQYFLSPVLILKRAPLIIDSVS